jgi:uncharacterized zinc-type alcohol dehydrogenase-like protein
MFDFDRPHLIIKPTAREPETLTIAAYAAQSATSPLGPFSITRREPRPNDVRIKILYCGVCHSNLHSARNDWHGSVYPEVPGHEIVGEVVETGAEAWRFKTGELVAVGCLVDSCLTCAPCEDGEEQFCQHGATGTYNGKDRVTGEITFGGYAQSIVVREQFVLRLPAGLDPARAAPILCAGITTYSPFKRWGVGKGHKIAVAGLGGLGHMGVKLAVALGADVTVITRSADKTADALALGVHAVLLSSDKEAMKAATGRFDLILDTIPVDHDVAPYLRLLKIDGTHVLVGAIGKLPSLHTGLLLGGRKRLSGSAIGGIKETQELLDFCATHNILPDCEMIAIQDINHAYERMERSDVKYRFVIDMASLA